MVLSHFCDENTDILDLLRHIPIWHYLQLRPISLGLSRGNLIQTRLLYDNENQIHGLVDTIQQLGSQGPSYVIIDGLDEYVDKIKVQMLVEKIAQLGRHQRIFEQLRAKSAHSSPTLRAAFSCRSGETYINWLLSH